MNFNRKKNELKGKINSLIKKLGNHDSKEQVKELKHEIREIRLATSDIEILQGNFKIDQYAEEEAERFKKKRIETFRKQPGGLKMIDMELENKLLKF